MASLANSREAVGELPGSPWGESADWPEVGIATEFLQNSYSSDRLHDLANVLSGFETLQNMAPGRTFRVLNDFAPDCHWAYDSLYVDAMGSRVFRPPKPRETTTSSPTFFRKGSRTRRGIPYLTLRRKSLLCVICNGRMSRRIN